MSKVIKLLQEMVRIDSVNQNLSGCPAPEKELAEFLEHAARAHGLSTRRLPVVGEQFNLFLSNFEKPSAPWVLLESHMDTVTKLGMTIDPLDPVIRQGRMFGRGACDTKSSGAAMFRALVEYLEEGGGEPVGLLFSVDEEVGKTGIRHFVKNDLPGFAIPPSFAVVGEPTLLHPVFAHNGAVRWKICTKGIPAHSSNPANGRSAIRDMMRVLDKLEQAYIPHLHRTHPLTGKAQCSINQIFGGRQANMIPDHCEIVLDRRLVPGEEGSEVLSTVESLLDEVRKEVPGILVEQLDAFLDPPMEPLGAEQILRHLEPALRQVGVPVKALGMPYGTDASNLTTAGIPAVVIGPGDIRQAHTVDEWIATEQVESAVGLYKKILRPG